jgi:hypothetical protein
MAWNYTAVCLYILKEEDVRVITGFNWLRIGYRDGLLEPQQ